ncbi:MAG: ribonuclease P protein component [Sphaerochaetaceae bacterium]|jgi:ribonuclease P protein component
MRKSLTKKEIVKYQPEINRIFKAGKTNSYHGLKLVVSKNQLDWSRVIVIPVRHYGTAVQRNRIRRQVKEIWRNEKERLASGYDFAFVVYPGNVYDHVMLKKQLIYLCEKTGVLLPSESSSPL